jgi:hypothetical protein
MQKTNTVITECLLPVVEQAKHEPFHSLHVVPWLRMCGTSLELLFGVYPLLESA